MKKVLVEATDISKKLNVKIKELGRVAEPGEQFEMDLDRYYLLGGFNNMFKAIFVKKATQPAKVVKKSRRKKVSK